jgi:hypothetical protein
MPIPSGVVALPNSKQLLAEANGTHAEAFGSSSNSSCSANPLRSSSSIFARVTDPSQADGRRRGVDHLVLFVVRLPPLQFLGGLALVAAEFGDQRDHSGVDARHQPIGFFPL